MCATVQTAIDNGVNVGVPYYSGIRVDAMKYLMTTEQIEALAAERTTSTVVAGMVDGTYLRALVAAVQAMKRTKQKTQLEAIDTVSTEFYAAVCRGVVTAEIALAEGLPADEAKARVHERNRRATFARSAKSALVAWVREGGDIRKLDLETVTKTELQKQVKTARVDRGESVTQRIERLQAQLLAAMAREPPETARERIETVIAALQDALEELPVAPPARPPTVYTRIAWPRVQAPKL